MKEALVFFLLILYFAIEIHADQCFDSSYSTSAADSLRNRTTSSTYTIEEGFLAVWDVSKTISSPHFVNLYFGLSNSDFFLIKYCKSVPNLANPYCVSGNADYVAFIRHSSFGHDRRRVYFVHSNNGTLGSLLGTETDSFNTTQRLWYTLRSGWSQEDYFFASGGSGRSYSVPITNGVAAADRDNREPCDTCLMNSWVIPAVQSAAALPVHNFSSITTQNQLQGPASALLSVLNAVYRGQANSVYYAFNNNDFYMIKDCLHVDNKDTTECIAAASQKQARYIVWIRNTAIYGDAKRRVFPIVGNQLDLSTLIVVSPEFNTTTRLFFTVQNGYSAVYDFASSGKGRAYSASFIGGVAAGSYSEKDPCRFTSASSPLQFLFGLLLLTFSLMM